MSVPALVSRRSNAMNLCLYLRELVFHLTLVVNSGNIYRGRLFYRKRLLRPWVLVSAGRTRWIAGSCKNGSYPPAPSSTQSPCPIRRSIVLKVLREDCQRHAFFSGDTQQ